jgi:hypothetical protein
VDRLTVSSAGVRADNGFGLNVAPIAPQAHIADPSGGATVDDEARAAIAAINARLEAFGFSRAS